VNSISHPLSSDATVRWKGLTTSQGSSTRVDPARRPSAPDTSWNPRRPQGNNFDFLRLLLAALVVYDCAVMTLYGPNETVYRVEIFSRLTGLKMTVGDLAVDGFFIISGFLITASWISTPSLWKFLSKRVLRIYPAYLVIAVLWLPVIGSIAEGAPGAHRFGAGALGHFVLRSIALQEVYVDGTLSRLPFSTPTNLSTWTIPYEFVCYVGVPLLALLGLYRRRFSALVLFAGWLVFEQLERHGVLLSGFRGAHSLGHALPRLGSFFLAGMCFYLYRDHIPRASWLAWVSVAVLAVCVVLGRGLDLALPIFGSYGLLYFAFWQHKGLSNFAQHGDLSYGTYLYHFPIQQLLAYFWYSHFNVYSLTLASGAITALCAWASWRFVEEPCLKLKPR
jgi:peptidoglycan/LPS O-acetylase OafA/YrhL